MRAAVTLLLLSTCAVLQAKKTNMKFSATTQMFLHEQAARTEAANAPGRTTDRRSTPVNRYIASPDTIDGAAYITCFLSLADPTDLSAVEALGVRVKDRYRGMEVVIAKVPVDSLSALAAIDNVTRIDVDRLMQPMTDIARGLTHVEDLLTLSQSARDAGLSTKYDGSGVVLGIIDTGIDFQHIAFKDKDGNSRIVRAYVSDENGNGHLYADSAEIAAITTDDDSQDHGTHTASTAGGSSVIVNKTDDTHFTVTVTDDHANATYGGMAPGAELFLAGVKYLMASNLIDAMIEMRYYAYSLGKPLVVSNSWGGCVGPRDGSGSFSYYISELFGNLFPNNIILFAASNDAGRGTDAEPGGVYVRKAAACEADPLCTIIRTLKTGGQSYSGVLCNVWSDSILNLTLYVLDHTGAVKASWLVTENSQDLFPGLETYYEGQIIPYFYREGDKVCSYVATNGLHSLAPDNEDYSLAVEFSPANDSVDVRMWSGDNTYFTNFLTTPGHNWQAGNDDMSVSDEAVIPDAISVGAYVSRKQWVNWEDSVQSMDERYTVGDIGYFSGYATAAESPSGLSYPWITAPGSMVAAAVSPYHTQDEGSYFDGTKNRLLVNDTVNPYGVMQGTSMATPVASGIVALWLQAAQEVGKTLTVNEVKHIMQQTAIHDSWTAGANATHFGQGKIDALAGIQYIRSHYAALTIDDDGDENTDAISAASATGKIYDVTLQDRIFYLDSAWITLCLPFDLNPSDEMSELFDATIMELDAATSGLNGTTLTLNFNPVTTMTAGKPYLVKWNGDDEIIDPVFRGVSITDATLHDVLFPGGAFKGTYDAIPFPQSNPNILLMGADNSLFWPQPDPNDPSVYPTIGACRAYFELESAAQAPDRIILNFNNNAPAITTDVENVRGQMAECPPDGTGGTASAEGGTKVLIEDLLYILRDGIVYDVLGRKISNH